MPTDLHVSRLDSVLRVLSIAGARTVLDLGCGTGELILRLLGDDQILKIQGVDLSATALDEARRRIEKERGAAADRAVLRHGSCVAPDPSFLGFDAVVLVETIEHIPPNHLSRLESTVFRYCRPRIVVVTTPNSDYNALYGVPDNRLRHREHHFEWGRRRFMAWAEGIGRRNGYSVETGGVGGVHIRYGAPSQIATFSRS